MSAFSFRLEFWESVNDFFTRMFEDILAGRVTVESMILVAAFFGGFAILTWLALTFSPKPKALLTGQPVTWVTDYNLMSNFLNAAVTQRCKVRASFTGHDNRARSTDGVFIESGKDGLLLELSTIKRSNPAWVGRSLELTFRLRLPDQPQVHTIFTFVSDIKSVRQSPDGIPQMLVSRPLRLEINQNRQHLRVDPSEKYLKAFKLWTEEQVRRRGDITDPDTWGVPAYVTQSGAENDIGLENVSGGGLRVKVSPGALRSKDLRITVGEVFIAQLTLAEPDFSGFKTHYLQMRLLKCYDDCESKTELSLGMIYIAVGEPNDPPLTGLRWRSVNRDHGLAVMDDWAYEVHLEMYRARGSA